MGEFSAMQPEVSSPSHELPPNMTGVIPRSDTPFIHYTVTYKVVQIWPGLICM